MRLGQIDFPEPLMAALRNRKLVVFAGAGVSMNSPSNLPDFKNLTRRVAEWAMVPKIEGETDDAYLGRLQRNNVEVHEQVAEFLTEDQPKPNSLHHDLLRIYRRQGQPKIATTNFDLLFEAVEQEPPPTTYSAPTLPPGHRFQGIVHLHGTTNQPLDMVLSDADVSVAYLHEGWALTFLKQLFTEFTVLFIGYSHDDTLMQYLARGMPAQADADQQRFALTIEDEDSEQRWRNRGVTPIIYPPNDRNRHANLAEAIAKLAEYVTRQPSQWRERITQIAERPEAPTDPEEQDVIKEALRDHEEKLSFFTDATVDPDWLEWLERNQYLNQFFESSSMDSRTTNLADWAATRFATIHPHALQNLLSRHPSTLNPRLWKSIADAIVNPTPQPDGISQTSQWASLLVNSCPNTSYTDLPAGLKNIARVCLRENLTDCVVLCFTRMMQMTVIVQPTLPPLPPNLLASYDEGDTNLRELELREWELFNQQPRVKLGTVCPNDMMDEIWHDMKGQLATFARPMLEQSVAQIKLRHETMFQWDPSTDALTVDSRARREISEANPAPTGEGINTIIDVARDCLNWICNKDKTSALNWCNPFVQSPAPLLKRLAVHAISSTESLTSDEKIDWLIRKGMIHDDLSTREVKKATEQVYSTASPAARERLINAIQSLPTEAI